MKGFVKNETGKAVFKAQRPLPPGSVLTFEDAYLVFENKSGKKKNQTFVKWLRDNVFAEEGWGFYKEEGVPFFPEKKVEAAAVKEEEPTPAPEPKVAPAKGAGRKLVRKARKVTKSNTTAASIIEADLPQAREMISKTKDRGTLKKALSLSSHFSKKEEHRRLIMRRLEEVY